MLRPKPHYPPPASLQPYVDFIRTADKVTLVGSTRFYDESAEPGLGIANEENGPPSKTKPFYHEKVATVSEREEAIQFLGDITHGDHTMASCFDPHHFIEATKGKDRIEIAICLSCGGIVCKGTNLEQTQANVGNPDWKTATRVFGTDMEAVLGRDAPP